MRAYAHDHVYNLSINMYYLLTLNMTTQHRTHLFNTCSTTFFFPLSDTTEPQQYDEHY